MRGLRWRRPNVQAGTTPCALALDVGDEPGSTGSVISQEHGLKRPSSTKSLAGSYTMC